MPVTIPDNLKKEYLDYFKDEAKAKIPSRDPKKYNVTDDFFRNIGHSKENLVSLLQWICFPSPKEKLEQDVYAEFTVTGHAKVRKLPGQQENSKTIVGQNSMMLKIGEEGTDIAVAQSKYADPNDIVFTSDLPRAIHHALLKYNPELREELDNFANDVQIEIARSGGIIGKEKRLCLIEMALTNGIIPTPLLRSHYHGPRDGLPESPEDWNKFDVNTFLRSDLCQQYFEKESEVEIRQELEELKKLGMTGKNPFQFVKGKDGKILTENLPLYIFRIAYLAELFAPDGEYYNKIEGRRVNFVGHSSNIDALSSYFRHFKKNKVVLEKADKSKTRGKELVIRVDSGFNYINDPEKLEGITKSTKKAVSDYRRNSKDKLIRGGNGIFETEFYRLSKNKETGEDRQEKITLTEILSNEKPTLVLGGCGLGKTTFSYDLSARLLPQSKDETDPYYTLYGGLNKGELYLPIHISLRQFSDIFERIKMENSEKDSNELSKQLLSGSLLQLPERSLKAYKKDGYQFVFVLDGYDELAPIHQETVSLAINSLKDHGKVIVTSRSGKFEGYEHSNSGFDTVNIDPESIVRNRNKYIDTRVDGEEKRKKFKEFMGKQSKGINDNYLMIFLATQLFNNGKLDLQTQTNEQEIMHRGIEWFIWEHVKERNPVRLSELSRQYGISNLEQIESRYMGEMKPYIRKIAAYMTVNDEPVVPNGVIQMILEDRWSLVTELQFRQRIRSDRFITDGEFKRGVRASTYAR